MKFIDLSHTISMETPVFPGDLPVQIRQDKEFNRDGYNNYQLCTGMHIGTHVDGPMHLTEDHRYVGNLSPDRFYGKGIVFDVQGMEKIDLDHLDTSRMVSRDVILFYSGRDKIFHQKEYFQHHPVLQENLIHFMVREKIKIVGIDWPSPDCDPYPMHQILLKNNILIVENLKNLDLLIGYEFEFFAFPLKIKADSSLTRAVARIAD